MRLEGGLVIIMLGREPICLVCAVTEFGVHSREHMVRAWWFPRVL